MEQLYPDSLGSVCCLVASGFLGIPRMSLEIPDLMQAYLADTEATEVHCKVTLELEME